METMSVKIVSREKALINKDKPETDNSSFLALVRKKGSKPKYSVADEIFVTWDYSLFSLLEGNREINWDRVARLTKAMSKKLLKIPIVVNGKFEVIDGQHRLFALINLKKPVYFQVLGGATLKDVQILNSNSYTWDSDSYLQSYLALGGDKFKAYHVYDKFQKEFGFGHQETQILLGEYKSSGSNLSRQFKEGRLKIPNAKKSWEYADKILQIGKFYPGYKRRSFVLAMVDIFKENEYDHATFLKQLKKQPRGLVDSVNKDQYKRLVEDIYNYGLSKQKRIRCY